MEQFFLFFWQIFYYEEKNFFLKTTKNGSFEINKKKLKLQKFHYILTLIRSKYYFF